MPKTRVTTQTIFAFDELSGDAKEKARAWYREGNLDHEWWDAVYEDAAQCGAVLGIDIAPRGKYGHEIWFSGFWSQGDGACFAGSWEYRPDMLKAIRDHAPQDTDLHAIADSLDTIPHPAGWSARMKHRGHYYHSGCMSVDVSFDDSNNAVELEGEELPQAEFTAGEETITQAMRDFADWIYKSLEREHEYLQSDEQVDESIRANEYEFTESGERA